ncbi:MAG: hypothetical protein F2681_15855 [Actinobacteria bacterium]|nr:hypothetical protein [Actinomycetota bacterium]MSW79155.1 hypothetical protein [Actinomycetota bacterium]MSX54411.1 hypothetical protein [Actinomycetota bacterium]MSX93784.1 hypothetical protein [Actinomycetota bacterium]MSZ84606.1 hypothetical protein [Actinomycetota bacterium]
MVSAMRSQACAAALDSSRAAAACCATTGINCAGATQGWSSASRACANCRLALSSRSAASEKLPARRAESPFWARWSPFRSADFDDCAANPAPAMATAARATATSNARPAMRRTARGRRAMANATRLQHSTNPTAALPPKHHTRPDRSRQLTATAATNARCTARSSRRIPIQQAPTKASAAAALTIASSATRYAPAVTTPSTHQGALAPAHATTNPAAASSSTLHRRSGVGRAGDQQASAALPAPANMACRSITLFRTRTTAESTHSVPTNGRAGPLLRTRSWRRAWQTQRVPEPLMTSRAFDARRPSQVVAIASTQRTGSYLLCAGLTAAGLAERPLHQWEVLHPWQVFHRYLPKPWSLRVRLHVGRLWRWWGAKEPWVRRMRTTVGARRAYLDFVAERFTTDDGVLGLKMMWPHLEQGLLLDGLEVSYWGAPVTWIHTWRRDEVRQAVSLARSEQTGQWLAGVEPPRNMRGRVPTYDAAFIERRLAHLRRNRTAWLDYFAEHEIVPINVVYEDLDADYEGTMRRVLDLLGKGDVPVTPRQTERQSDGMNDEWVERFLRDRPQYGPAS